MKVMLLSLPGMEEQDGCLFPLGLGYLVAILKPAHEVQPYHYQTMRAAVLDIPAKVEAFHPDVIGLTCNSFNRGGVRKIISLIRAIDEKVLVVVGGVHASFCYDQVLTNYGADVVVIGEGEYTLQQLCENVQNKQSLSQVNGIAFKRNGEVVVTPPREVATNLDLLPLPDYSYARDLIESSRMGMIITSRGCPVQCTFCSTSSYWGQRVRMFSPSRVVDEMEMLVSQYHVKKIFFHDDTFNLGISRVEAICKEIKSRGVNVEWGCSCRVVPVSEAMLDMMVDAGCRHICWGIESGSEEILKRINKKISLAQVMNAYELSRKHSAVMSTGAFVMVGNSGESSKTINETIKFLNTIPLTDSPSTSVLYVLPGTLLYSDLKERGLVKEEDWVRYDTVPSYTLEHSYLVLAIWAWRVNRSGLKIPFDSKRHFWSVDRVETSVLESRTGGWKILKALLMRMGRPACAMGLLRRLLPAGRVRF